MHLAILRNCEDIEPQNFVVGTVILEHANSKKLKSISFAKDFIKKTPSSMVINRSKKVAISLSASLLIQLF